MRYFVRMLLIVVFCIISFDAESADDFYKSLINENIDILHNHGIRCLTSSPDSAVMFFSGVCARYQPGMSGKDKITVARAYNNLGYMSFFHQGNPAEAYRYFLRSEDICREINDSSIFPFVFINIANVFAVVDDYDAAMQYYKKSFWSSVEMREYSMLLTSFSALLIQSMMEDDFSSIKEEIRRYQAINVPDMPMKDYTDEILRGCLQIDAGDYDEGISILENTFPLIDSPYEKARYEYTTKALISHAAAQKGNYAKAIILLKDIPVSSAPLDIRVGVAEKVAGLYEKAGKTDSANIFRLRYLALSDTMLRMDKMKAIRDTEAEHTVAEMNKRLTESLHDKERQQWILWTVVAVLLTVLAGGLRWWVSYKKLKASHKALYLKNQELLKSQPSFPETSMAEPTMDEREEADKAEDEDALRLSKRIRDVMESSKEVYLPGFSIDRLSQLLDESPKKISRIINENLASNFSTLLQTYRIKEACVRLNDTETYGRLTIEALAEGLGFKSRSNFASVFKRHTGLTPSEYQKIARDMEAE